jgi:putative flippase GtrA
MTVRDRVDYFLKLQPVKFLQGGVFMKAFAFFLNYILVSFIHLEVKTAYGIVLVCDFFLGFFVNRFFVFKKDELSSHKRTLLLFIVTGLIFRVCDGLVYLFLVEKLSFHIVLAQFSSVVFVLSTKYFIYKKVFK